MSLHIEIDDVIQVLLPDSKWYAVADNSFELDSYEFHHGAEGRFNGGQEEPTLRPPGATWKEPHGEIMYCPMTSVVAIKTERGKSS